VGLIRVETLMPAPVEVCFDLARDLDLHVKTTGASQERVVSAPHRFVELGDEIVFEARHLGLRRRLTSRIVQFDAPHSFTDEMVRGPFRRLRHEHIFEARGQQTLMIDIFDFAFFWPVDPLFLDGYMRRFLQRRGEALAEVSRSSGNQT
jgi:ligand-binding SRPBCC domain-containing protein